jgi:hypothetical protein
VGVSLVDEVRGADFGDKRLNARLVKLAEELGNKPHLSIPAATHGRAEMEAAYRFFDNDRVSPDKILESHVQATHERISQCDLVLLAQDTTELDLTRPEQQVRGAGPIDCETRRGAFLHPLHAWNIEGLPLGTVWQKTWTRDAIATDRTAAEKNQKRKQTPLEEKESVRWLEGIRATREVGRAHPQTTCVAIADSESDIYELLSEPRSFPEGEIQLLIRAGQTRSTADESNWLEKARATPCLYTCVLNVSARTAKVEASRKRGKREQSREARVAEVEVRATTVTLRPPYRFDRKLPEVTVQVVLVEEADPPQGCEPIQWLLVTTLPVATSEQVKLIVQAYCVRWQIEIFFRTLKTGCRVQKRMFETLPRLENCVAVYCIIAWRIMYLCRLGRTCPDLDCEVVFEPSEWKAVYVAVKRKPPPETPPRLNEIIRLIASLGGYVIRRSTNPGPQTLWIGLQRVYDLSTAWTAFGPDS